jgi:DNA-binding response OmpR family regulator
MPSVLIIEDAQELREMLGMFLSRLGYEIFEATNGLDGLKMAKMMYPSLIILDLMMPVAAGDLTLGFLRSTDSLKNIPVIVTSAHPNAKAIAKQLGAEACLEKPFSFEELRAVVDKFVPPVPNSQS